MIREIPSKLKAFHELVISESLYGAEFWHLVSPDELLLVCQRNILCMIYNPSDIILNYIAYANTHMLPRKCEDLIDKAWNRTFQKRWMPWNIKKAHSIVLTIFLVSIFEDRQFIVCPDSIPLESFPHYGNWLE